MTEPAPALDRLRELPILVLSPHNRCNCRCVMCDIWRIRQVRELTASDLEPHLEGLRALHVQWIVLSGGEPLLHSDLAPLCRALRTLNVRLTLLTAGLPLARLAPVVAAAVDDVIVSLDGPAEVHDRIRAVPGAFGRLAAGVAALRRLRPDMPVRGRCTVQQANCRALRATVTAAKALGLNSISFLAVDVASEAFNRAGGWPEPRRAGVAPDAADVAALESEIEALALECSRDIAAGFVVEPPEKLRRIARGFRAGLGQAEPVAPRCNAPWVSAVVEADGAVRPCFFHRAIGNLHRQSLDEALNGDAAREFRRGLDMANDPICRRCVCSLMLERPGAA